MPTAEITVVQDAGYADRLPGRYPPARLQHALLLAPRQRCQQLGSGGRGRCRLCCAQGTAAANLLLLQLQRDGQAPRLRVRICRPRRRWSGSD